MVSPNVNKLLHQAQSLSLVEREQLLELLQRESRPNHTEASEDRLVATLAKNGIRLTLPPKRTAEELVRFKAWRPIEMPGGSLSDELIRDRR